MTGSPPISRACWHSRGLLDISIPGRSSTEHRTSASVWSCTSPAVHAVPQSTRTRAPPSPPSVGIPLVSGVCVVGPAPSAELRDGCARLMHTGTEMIKLGGAESLRWFKSLFDAIWHEEEVPEDWKSQLLIPLHKKGSRTIEIIIMALASSVPPARSSQNPS